MKTWVHFSGDGSAFSVCQTPTGYDQARFIREGVIIAPASLTVESLEPDDFYCVAVEKEPMTPEISALYAGVDEPVEITGVPAGAVLSVDFAEKGQVDDGKAELAFEHPGLYRIRLEHRLFKAVEYKIEVTA